VRTIAAAMAVAAFEIAEAVLSAIKKAVAWRTFCDGFNYTLHISQLY